MSGIREDESKALENLINAYLLVEKQNREMADRIARLEKETYRLTAQNVELTEMIAGLKECACVRNSGECVEWISFSSLYQFDHKTEDEKRFYEFWKDGVAKEETEKDLVVSEAESKGDTAESKEEESC